MKKQIVIENNEDFVGILRFKNDYDKSMIFIFIPKTLKDITGEIPEVDLELHSFVKMKSLSEELQEKIRKELENEKA